MTLHVDELTPEQASAVAADAFVFGYPLVLMDVTRAVDLNRVDEHGRRTPVNRFRHVREFPDATFDLVVSPNADTLYSTAWLDLVTEPVVLRALAAGGHYHLLPLLSGWTDVFASPGTRTAGDDGGAFAIAGPGWDGELPAGVTEIRSPTAMVLVIGRTQANGRVDYECVHRFQDGLSLTPLSAWGGRDSSPAAAPVDPGVDFETPPPDQVAAMSAEEFFGRLAPLMVANPPSDADAPALERLAGIGLAPGTFEPGAQLAASLDAGVTAALARLRAASAPRAERGWTMHRGLGSYGTEYAQRAVVALIGLGANLDADSVYPHTSTDSEGHPLDGTRRYVLRFEPGLTPPARAFWSLTMYNERHYFVDNPIDRYAIGDRDPLVFNADGSLDLWLQHESPAPERAPNWLPAPPGRFTVILRIYWPAQEALDGTWSPPPVRRA